MSHRVFISYSSKDIQPATQVCAALEAEGIPCWMDKRSLAAGNQWASELVDAINNCEIVLLLFSKSANDSSPVANEIARASNQQKTIITVRIEDAFASGDLEFFLTRVHWLDAFPRSIDNYLEAIVHAVQNPSLNPRVSPSPLVDEDFLNSALQDISCQVVDLERNKQPLRCSAIDTVFESALGYAKRLQEAERWEPCLRIFSSAATGVLRVLDMAPEVSTFGWPVEVEQLQLTLRSELARITEADVEPDAAVHSLRGIFVDFLDRVIPMREETAAHRWVTIFLVACLFVSGLSLFFAYSNATTTWDIHYSYAYGIKYGRIGGNLEFSRSVLLLIAATYLFKSLFRTEFDRLILDWSWRSWRRPGVLFARACGLLLVAHTAWTVSHHIVNVAPSHEGGWAKDYLIKLDLPKNKDEMQPLGEETAKKVRKSLAEESELGREFHVRPYWYYLPYCLVNYSVYAAMLVILSLFAILSDRWRLKQERHGLDMILANHRVKDRDVDREFERFVNACFRHTQRYITLLLWIAIIISYEAIVTRPTLSAQGWSDELMLSTLVGMTTLIWVGILMHFYEGAFQRCCNEKRRRHGMNERWSDRWNTTRFLSKSFLNLRGFVAVTIYLIPIFLILFDVLRR